MKKKSKSTMQKTVWNLVEGKWVDIQRFWLTLKKMALILAPGYYVIEWNDSYSSDKIKITRGIQTLFRYVLSRHRFFSFIFDKTIMWASLIWGFHTWILRTTSAKISSNVEMSRYFYFLNLICCCAFCFEYSYELLKLKILDSSSNLLEFYSPKVTI